MVGFVVGQIICVKGFKGVFVYIFNMVCYFGMIVGGIGIIFMFQVICVIVCGCKVGDIIQVDFIFVNVIKEDILFKEDFDVFIKEDKGICVYYVLDKFFVDWQGGVGYVIGDMIIVGFFFICFKKE